MIVKSGEKVPTIGKDVSIADSAYVIGDVRLGESSNVWYGAAIRGDINSIIIGANTNVQDNTVIHVSAGHPVKVGKNVVIGHSVILHGCTVGDNCLIGMGAILLDGCIIGDNSMVAAGAIVTQGSIIEPGSLVMGMPGKVVRKTTLEEREGIKHDCDGYSKLAKLHLPKGDKCLYSVVITTCPDEKTANALSRAIVEKNLAPCVQAEKINSIYSWEGEVVDESEIRLTIKCKQSNARDVFDFIKLSHPYKVPEIIELPIRNGDSDYLQWLMESGNLTIT